MHKEAPAAHVASVAAQNQGKFWEYHDKLYDNQRSLNRETFLRHAQELGLDMDRFEADLASPESQKRIDQDMTEARALGVSGTPGFFYQWPISQWRQAFRSLS